MASRNQKIIESPVVRWYTWKTIYDKNDNAVDGALVYFDKSKGENGENVVIECPKSFALINDNCVCFKGYNETTKEGVWSNEGFKKEHVIVVKNKQGELMRFKLGDYQKVKDELKGHHAKYCKVLYLAEDNGEGGFDLVGLTLTGGGLTGGVDQDNFDPSEKTHGFFNFTKSLGKSGKLMSNFITFKEGAIKKKGKNKFFVPVFEVGQEISEEENAKLLELNNILDEYHNYYYSNKDAKTETPVSVEQGDDFVS